MRRHSRAVRKGTPESDLEKNHEHDRSTNECVKEEPSLIKEYLIDYTSNSNLHGLKYIGDKERTIYEKLFWLITFFCCVGLCTEMMFQVWIKWKASPVIVNFSENASPVWQIPFPAVTICPATKSLQTKFNFTKYYRLQHVKNNNMTTEERNLYDDVSMLCHPQFVNPFARNFSLGNETVQNIKKVSLDYNDLFLACLFQDKYEHGCGNLFSSMLTEEGFCYTFNSLGAEQIFRLENLHREYEYLKLYGKENSTTWDLERGYLPNAPLATYPRRGSGSGATSGLKAILGASHRGLDYVCAGYFQGFKISLHHPAELPRPSQQFFRLSLSQEALVAVKPKLITTSEGLRHFTADARQCYFEGDRYLQYFKIYTQANCKTECLVNYTYAKCECVHFGMPRGPHMNVCNVGRRECMEKAKLDLATVDIRHELGTKEDDETNISRNIALRCKCLPSCTSIEYETENSQTNFDFGFLFRKFFNLPLNMLTEFNKTSHLIIYFKESQYISSRRSELYGKADILANCGGLLGLFMGFSILSVVEIIYYLTLRLYFRFGWKQLTSKKKNLKTENTKDKLSANKINTIT